MDSVYQALAHGIGRLYNWTAWQTLAPPLPAAAAAASTMAALRSSLNFAGSYESFIPRIGATFLAEVFPAMRAAKPPPAAGDELRALIFIFQAIVSPGAGAAASQHVASGFSSSWQGGSGSHGSGSHLNQIAPSLASSLLRLGDGLGSGTSSACGWFAGAVSAPALPISRVGNTAALPSSAANGSKLLRSQLFAAAAAAGFLWCNGLEKSGDSSPANVDANGIPDPTPPPNGNGGRGMGDKDKALFINLLIDLQKQLKSMLDYEDCGKDVKADVIKKKEMIVLDSGDLAETRAKVEALLKELQEGDGVHQLIPIMKKFAHDLASMEQKILAQTKVRKNPIKVKLVSALDEGSVLWWFFDSSSVFGEILSFIQGKVMVGIGIVACVKSKVNPHEAAMITLRLFEDTIDGKRARIERLKDKVGGIETEDLDPTKVMEEVKELLEEQQANLKVIQEVKELLEVIGPNVKKLAGSEEAAPPSQEK